MIFLSALLIILNIEIWEGTKLNNIFDVFVIKLKYVNEYIKKEKVMQKLVYEKSKDVKFVKYTLWITKF